MKLGKIIFIIIPLITSLFIFQIIGCSGKPQIQNILGDSLSAKFTKALRLYKGDLPKYKSEAAKIDEYENQLKSLRKSNVEGFSDIYSQMQLLVGYWITNGTRMNNICPIIKTGSSGIYTGYLQEDTILDISQRLADINGLQVKLRWAKNCNEEIKQISSNIENLELLSTKLKFSVSKWNSKQIGQNLYSIDGPDLGIYMNAIADGEWYYYADKNDFQPHEQQAKSLYKLIDNVETFESKSTKEHDATEPIALPQNAPCSPSVIAKYYFDNFGIYIPTRGGGRGFSLDKLIDFKYSKDSDFVQELYSKYPVIRDYWGILDKLGFKVVCGTLDLDFIKMNYWAEVPYTDETIILRVSNIY